MSRFKYGISAGVQEVLLRLASSLQTEMNKSTVPTPILTNWLASDSEKEHVAEQLRADLLRTSALEVQRNLLQSLKRTRRSTPPNYKPFVQTAKRNRKRP